MHCQSKRQEGLMAGCFAYQRPENSSVHFLLPVSLNQSEYIGLKCMATAFIAILRLLFKCQMIYEIVAIKFFVLFF